MSLASALALGFVLGLKHALDADHVAAVSAIVARHKKLGTAWLLGAFWGLGHTATVFAVGVLIILFRVQIPPRLGLGMEFTVGVMLCLLGILSLLGRLGGGVTAHSHRHEHDGEHGHGREGAHSHAHLHAPETGWLKKHLALAGRWALLRSLAVGLVHGLAGSAAAALLALAAIADPWAGLLYLAVFGAGTLVGMLSVSALMERAMAALARWWGPGERAVAVLAGLLSLAVGLSVMHETGLQGGLFTDASSWRPR